MVALGFVGWLLSLLLAIALTVGVFVLTGSNGHRSPIASLDSIAELPQGLRRS
jgi:hypothetical protein